MIHTNSFRLSDLHTLLGDAIILLALLPEATYYVLSKIYNNQLPLFLVALLMNVINLAVVLTVLLITKDFFMPHLNIDDILVLLAIGLASAMFYGI